VMAHQTCDVQIIFDNKNLLGTGSGRLSRGLTLSLSFQTQRSSCRPIHLARQLTRRILKEYEIRSESVSVASVQRIQEVLTSPTRSFNIATLECRLPRITGCFGSIYRPAYRPGW